MSRKPHRITTIVLTLLLLMQSAGLPVAGQTTMAGVESADIDVNRSNEVGDHDAVQAPVRQTEYSGEWQQVATFQDSSPYVDESYTLTASPNFQNDNSVFLTTDGDLYRSQDRGASWMKIFQGGYRLPLPLFSPDYSSDSTMYLSDYPWDLYRSTDKGTTWIDITPDRRCFSLGEFISPAFLMDNTIYAPYSCMTNDGVHDVLKLYRSPDRGNTWTEVESSFFNELQPQHNSRDGMSFYLSPGFANDNTLWLASCLYENQESGSIYRSQDGGTSWTDSGYGLDNSCKRNMQFSPNYISDSTIFVWNHLDPVTTIARSIDGGVTWEQVMLPTSGSWLGDLHFSPYYATDQVIFGVPHAIADGQFGWLVRSTDGGTTWTLLDAPSTEFARLVFSPNRDNKVFLVSRSQILVSEDLGNSWTQLNTPTVDVIYDLLIVPSTENRQKLFIMAKGDTENTGVLWVSETETANPNSISGRVTDANGSGVAGVTVTATATAGHAPLIFIPGIGGSVLKQPGASLPIWPNLLEPDENLAYVVRYLLDGVLSIVAETAWGRMVGNAEQLRLSPDDDYATSLIASDVVRWVVAVDIYGSLLEDFLEKEQDYRPYRLDKDYLPVAPSGCDDSQSADLFVFPYDWRLPIERTAQRLADYIACVREIHPDAEVDILAHSMGGLVARRYVLDQQAAGQPNHIRRFITLGSPWLGAPKLINTLLTGDFELIPNLLLINKEKLKDLLPTWPGAHQLLPTDKYIRTDDIQYIPPFREDGWDVNGKNGATETYSHNVLLEWLDNKYSATKPMTRNEQFHSQSGQDDWQGDASGIEYHHIVGIVPGTINQVIAQRHCWLGPFLCSESFVTLVSNAIGPYEFWMGDGTVPLNSAKGNSIGSGDTPGIQYYHPFRDPPPSALPIGLPTTTKKYEHGKLPLDEEIQECIDGILTNGVCPTSLSTAGLESARAVASEGDQYDILVVGTGSAIVSDAVGNVTGWMEDIGAMLRNVPDVYYYDTGGDSVQIMALTTQPLTITFRSGATPLFVEILKTTGTEIAEAVRYPDLIVEPNTTLALALPLAEVAPLSIDTTGDGAPDSPVGVAPMRVAGPAAGDTLPPTVALSVDLDRVLTVIAEDESGVVGVYYSFDGAIFQPYVGPIAVPYAVTAAYAFADDVLANRSSPATLPLTPDTTPPNTVLMIVGTHDGQGFTGPVTVSLLARDDNSGVIVSYLSLDGGQSWQEYTAPVEFELEPGQSTTILAYSVDRAGNQESPPVASELVFSAIMGPVEIPSIISPLDGAVFMEDDEITLQWVSSSNAKTYAAELFTTNEIINSGRLSATYWYLGTLPIGAYAWRVEAYNDLYWSGWTLPANFSVAPYTILIQHVEPAPPYCVVLNSLNTEERTIRIHGNNLPTMDHHLQFKRLDTGDETIHFGIEVDWQSELLASIDVATIAQYLWGDDKVSVAVRLTDSSYLPASRWSTEFIIASDIAACGVQLPTPTVTATPTPTDTTAPTATSTATSSPTNSATATPTGTTTHSPTSSATPTPTNTPVPATTSTATPTPTNSPTRTPTSTATRVPTSTPTMRPTNPPPNSTRVAYLPVISNGQQAADAHITASVDSAGQTQPLAPAGSLPTAYQSSQRSVTAVIYTTTTDAGGYYSFANLPPGIYEVAASRDGFTIMPAKIVVTLPGNTTDVNFLAESLTATPTSTPTGSPTPTLTPSATPDFDPAEEILISAGFFKMGCQISPWEGSCAQDELPLHTVNLSSYYIEKYEVTNGRYEMCVNAGSCSPPQQSGSATRPSYYGNPDYANFPVIYVNWHQANAFCTWQGKRLPTEAEWEKAARGSRSTRKYPWGDSDPFACLSANYTRSVGAPCWGDTIPTYEYYTVGLSPYGVANMAGNVWEWVNDWYRADFYSVSPINDPLGPETGESRVLRGGSWNSWSYDIRVANRREWGSYPSDSYNDVGFRCARSP